MAARTKTKVSPKYKTNVSGEELASVRHRSQRQGQHHSLVRRGGDLLVECTSKRASWWTAQILQPGDCHRIDLEDGVPPASAADRRFSGFSDWLDGPRP